MPLVRMLVSWGRPSDKVADRLTNTLYFSVSGSVDDPDYQALADDLRDVYASIQFTAGAKIEVRAYNMDDAKPRPEKAYSTVTRTGTWTQGVRQVAIALSYYADRNLPRQRGRIFTGPWPTTSDVVSSSYPPLLLTFAQGLAGIGGLNVDWSVYSPTSNDHKRISRAWVDNSWDIIRSRKLPATTRDGIDLNG